MFVSFKAPTATVLLLCCAPGCKSEESPVLRVAPPEIASALITAEDVSPSNTITMPVEATGSAKFLIDAPLEKIRGEATLFRGVLHGNPRNLAATSGQLEVDLKSLALSTFEDEDKNATQTEHAQNWLGLGSDVPESQRMENQWVRFSLQSLSVAPNDLNEVAETLGRRTVQVTAEGALWLHGVSVQKKVKLELSFTGPADSPTAVELSTVQPLTLSLKEHDVKPRDITGKFLQGALEKVGDKIVDEVQLSVSSRASAQ